MSDFDYDLFTIGAGSGGVRAARMAAGFGARVAVAEEHRVGGTCVIRGCVPKKLLVYASHFAEDFEDARGFGWDVGTPRFSWPDLIRAKDKEINRLNQIYLGLLSDAGVRLYQERGECVDSHHIQVGDQREVLVPIAVLMVNDSLPEGWNEAAADEPSWWEESPTASIAVPQATKLQRAPKKKPTDLCELAELE